MKRFSPTIPGDPADKAHAVAIHGRAIAMVEAGYLSADYQNGCITLADVRRKVEAAEQQAATGPQEPPQDYRIFNRRRADGTFRPLSGFFEPPAPAADACPPDNAYFGKVGEPLTPRQEENIRTRHAEFRANGGTYNDLG